MVIYKSTTLEGKKVKLKPQGFSITTAAITAIEARLKEATGGEATSTHGSLAAANLSNFQREYHKARLASPAAGSDAWAVTAVKAISFGKSRIAKGYTEIEVKPKADKATDLGDPYGTPAVPTGAESSPESREDPQGD